MQENRGQTKRSQVFSVAGGPSFHARFFFPVLKLRVPRPFDYAQGRLLRFVRGRIRCCR